MTPAKQMEQISLTYVRAVASQAGYQVTIPESDNDSVDGVLMAQFGRRPRIEFQAKSTTRDVLRNGIIYFPLPIKNYEELRVESWVPRILVVMLMPRDNAARLSQTTTELCLYHCTYWLSLASMPARPNTSNVTVEIPTSNIFDRGQLDALMNRANEGRSL